MQNIDISTLDRLTFINSSLGIEINMKKILFLLLVVFTISHAGWKTKLAVAGIAVGGVFVSKNIIDHFIESKKETLMKIYEKELKKDPKEVGCLKLHEHNENLKTIIKIADKYKTRDERFIRDIQDYAYGTEREINLKQYDNMNTYGWAIEIKQLIVSFLSEDPKAKHLIGDLTDKSKIAGLFNSGAIELMYNESIGAITSIAFNKFCKQENFDYESIKSNLNDDQEYYN